MAYIEENLKLRQGIQARSSENKQRSKDDLFDLPSKYKVEKPADEGNVTNSLAMLTAIPEVDLGMECVLHVLAINLHEYFTDTPLVAVIV